MNTTSLQLNEIYVLAFNVLKKHGCDELNAEAVAKKKNIETQMCQIN